MWTSFLVAMGGVVAVGLLGFVVAWQAGKAATAAARRERPDTGQLERSLERIEEEIRHARELARASR